MVREPWCILAMEYVTPKARRKGSGYPLNSSSFLELILIRLSSAARRTLPFPWYHLWFVCIPNAESRNKLKLRTPLIDCSNPKLLLLLQRSLSLMMTDHSSMDIGAKALLFEFSLLATFFIFHDRIAILWVTLLCRRLTRSNLRWHARSWSSRETVGSRTAHISIPGVFSLSL